MFNKRFATDSDGSVLLKERGAPHPTERLTPCVSPKNYIGENLHFHDYQLENGIRSGLVPSFIYRFSSQ